MKQTTKKLLSELLSLKMKLVIKFHLLNSIVYLVIVDQRIKMIKTLNIKINPMITKYPIHSKIDLNQLCKSIIVLFLRKKVIKVKVLQIKVVNYRLSRLDRRKLTDNNVKSKFIQCRLIMEYQMVNLCNVACYAREKSKQKTNITS